MKIISWNVNGIRSVLKKGFADWVAETSADLICLQETKISLGDLAKHVPVFPGYTAYFHAGEKKGYSGVAVLSKYEPISVRYGLNDEDDLEGRVITLEFDAFILVNAYAPNSQSGFARIDFRLGWDAAFRSYLQECKARKPTIVCADFNVAHTELDVGVPDAFMIPGCSPRERKSFSALLGAGFVDTYRHLHPDERDYSWWSYAGNARTWNAGIRFDYILVSEDLKDTIHEASTHRERDGSDHGPVSAIVEPSFERNMAPSPSVPLGQSGFAF